MSDTVLADTGYWIALFDPRDKEHDTAYGKAEWLESLTLVMPWPILYETLRTRFVRRKDWVARLDERLNGPDVVFVDDQEYCESAYSLSVEYSTHLRRPISMVDMLCRLLIADPNIRVDSLSTVNASDFFDVCLENDVVIL